MDNASLTRFYKKIQESSTLYQRFFGEDMLYLFKL